MCVLLMQIEWVTQGLTAFTDPLIGKHRATGIGSPWLLFFSFALVSPPLVCRTVGLPWRVGPLFGFSAPYGIVSYSCRALESWDMINEGVYLW